MPDPREAIYDVLLAKKRRAEAAKTVAKKAAEIGFGWAEYETANQVAHSAYTARRGR